MLSQNAIRVARDFIARWEGLELEAYKCPAGVWTIGYGHTEGVRPGDKVTEEEALALLEYDMAEAIQCVNERVEIELHDYQFAALISFVFNVGCDAFRNSTLLKLLNVNEVSAAAGQFKRWNKANGKVIQGLTNRRLTEEKLFRGES